MSSITVIVLAAGGSLRLGHPKQLVLWNGEPLVRRAVKVALEAKLGPVRVVLGSGAVEVAQALEGLPYEAAFNPHWSSGIASSIRAGVAGLDSDVLLMTCDQPAVSSAHLGQLAAALATSERRIAASAYAGVCGTPAVFRRALQRALLSLQGDQGARAVMEAEPGIARVELDRGGFDVDTPADLERLVAMEGASGVKPA